VPPYSEAIYQLKMHFDVDAIMRVVGLSGCTLTPEGVSLDWLRGPNRL
jgi:hypothetical protein